MTIRLLPTAIVLAFAATLFTLGVIAFDTLDADRYVDESRATQAQIREASNARRQVRRLSQNGSQGATASEVVRPGTRQHASSSLPTPHEQPSGEGVRGARSVTTLSVAGRIEAARAPLAATEEFETQPCRSPVCTPPATWRSVRSFPPYDAPVRFGGADRFGMWSWIKDGESATPCTAAEEARLRRISAEHADSYRRACDVAIGEPLFRNMQFQVPRSTARLSAKAESRPVYTASIVTDIGRTCIGRICIGPTCTGEHDMIGPLVAGQRCAGTPYSPPYTTYVAVWSPRQSVQRCVCINFGNPPTRTRFYGEHRVDEWLLLPVPTSVRLLRDGSPSPDRFIEVKAFPLSRSCWPCMAAGEGEVLLSRVDINLLPQIGWGGGVWP